ncbi:hypothetical protein QT987_21625 [Microcoleus sp. SVA1B4]
MVAELTVVLGRCFASNCLIFDYRAIGRKVSGKAGEGILMIIACGWPRLDSPLGLFFTPQITASGVPKAHLITIDACKMFVCDRRH